MLEPQPAPRDPQLISDGGGLPFPPTALVDSPDLLDPEDPAVGALIAHLSPAAPRTLEGWRLLARTDSEVLFARGYPPKLITLAFEQDARRRTWKCTAVSKARPLRATRDGIRASSWRLDPTHELTEDGTLLRVLVTEQTFSGAQRATGRVLPPDLYVDSEELVLTLFVTPRPGFQVRAPNPETPVRVALPHPIGSRQLIDGAVFGATL